MQPMERFAEGGVTVESTNPHADLPFRRNLGGQPVQAKLGNLGDSL